MLSKLKKRMGRRMYPVQSTPLPENLASGTGEVGIAALLSDGEYQHDEGVIAHGLTAVQVAAVAAFHQAIEGNPADDSRQRRSIEQPLSLILHFPHDSQKQPVQLRVRDSGQHKILSNARSHLEEQVHEAHPILRHRRALLDSNLTDPSVKSEYVQYAVNIERDRHRFVAQNYEIPLANGHLSRIRALPPMTVIVTLLLELTGTAKIDDGATLFVLKYAQAVLEFTCGSNEERLKALFVATVTEHFRGMRMPQEAFADTSLADVAVKAAVKREQELLATARQYYKRDDVDKVLNVALVKQPGESKSLKFSYVDLVRKLDGYLACVPDHQERALAKPAFHPLRRATACPLVIAPSRL